MGTKLHYKPGSFYRVCDRTGFAYRAEGTRKQWNNIIVRERSFEERQPQDFVRGRRDDQTVPEPRPRQVPSYLGVQTTIAYSITLTLAPGWSIVPASGGFSSGFSVGFDIGGGIAVTSATGFNVGDSISIQLDNGSMFFTTAVAVNYQQNTITPATPLPFPASGGNIVTDMTSFANV
jgi:hypothetical protein